MVVGDGGTGKIERLSGATKDGVMPMSHFTCNGLNDMTYEMFFDQWHP